MEIELYFELCQPFPIEDVEVLPGATNGAKDKALAMPYADLRAYQRRLDLVVGPGNWQVSYRPWGENAAICSLTIQGIVREDVGEEKAGDPNCRTSAVAQAFKRTCSSFGLGRYLYDLPAVWAAYDANSKRFKDPVGAVKEIYSKAGLLKAAAVTTPQTQKPMPASQAANPSPVTKQGTEVPVDQVDMAELKAMSDVELKRLNWGHLEGRALLSRDFGVGSRDGLDPAAYCRFLAVLKSIPRPPADEKAPMPERQIRS